MKKPSTKSIDDEYPINDLTNIKDLCIYEPKGSKEDNILRDLYFLIPQENKIEKLVLFHANLTNVSILSDFPLYNLKHLDLSLNNITNIKFLERINFNQLKYLYLNHNKISDISPLINYYILKQLRVLSLNKNPLNYNDNKTVIERIYKQGCIIDIINGHFEEDVFDRPNFFSP